MGEDADVTTVKEIPISFAKGSIFNIDTTDVKYYTHGFFKYPCKFIPQIPDWSFRYYKEKMSVDSSESIDVYDPFMGSGTSLVEASLNGYRFSGSDIDPLGRLLSKVKSEHYSKKDLDKIRNSINQFYKKIQGIDKTVVPALPNIDHWFSKSNIQKLGKIRYFIDLLEDEKSKNFLLVVFASVIRKSSMADEMSPKPYISSRFKKSEIDPIVLFETRAEDYFGRLSTPKFKPKGRARYIGNDARKSSLKSGSINVAVTSPPYINAFDYVRTLKLENYWLGLVDDDYSVEIRKGNIGTENIKMDQPVEELDIKQLRNAVSEIRLKDKKRALVVDKYFSDMNKNMADISRVTKSGGLYVVVVADSMIRNTHVPTRDILIKIARNNGFKLKTYFGYVIRNRYLRIPRGGKGGFMKVDWVIVLEKTELNEQ